MSHLPGLGGGGHGPPVLPPSLAASVLRQLKEGVWGKGAKFYGTRTARTL